MRMNDTKLFRCQQKSENQNKWMIRIAWSKKSKKEVPDPEDTLTLDPNLQLSSWGRQMCSEETFYSWTKQRWSCLSTLTRSLYGGVTVRLRPKNTEPVIKHGGVSIMMWFWCTKWNNEGSSTPPEIIMGET
uniref:Uncharacterized protein n=1 Tax=Nothobranchius furzeri TaxID=105023 RepID=A0A1A8UJ04_NOTFU